MPPPSFQNEVGFSKAIFFTHTQGHRQNLEGCQSFHQNWRLGKLREKNRSLMNKIPNKAQIPTSLITNGFTAELTLYFPFLFSYKICQTAIK